MSIQSAVRALKEEASIVALLSRLGHEPLRKTSRERFYISMIRNDDHDPSFTVYDEQGVWFDHGIGKGGNIIDFGLAYWKNRPFKEVVARLTELAALPVPGLHAAITPGIKRRPQREPNYVVKQTRKIGTHPVITGYLKARGIFEAAKDLLCEVYYYIEDQQGQRKHFYAAGWKNENGGWQVRNQYFKGCLGHQGITFIRGHDKKLAVFEGCMNYLSWRMENPDADHSIITLNSVTALAAGIARAKAFSAIDLYLDRDKTGTKAAKDFIAALPYATDRSAIYDGYNDYNDRIKALLKQGGAQVATDNSPQPNSNFLER